jgi:DNA-binding CsgD family transcriptional regulator
MGTDDVIACVGSLKTGPNHQQMLILNRPANERDFSEYETRLIRQLFKELTPLIGGPLASCLEPSPSQLSPRCRQVLACVLEGDSDRQVAKRLELSTHTVNQYLKAIFRHFHVSSRTELMARWIRRAWGATLAWRNGPIPMVEIPTVLCHRKS